MKQVAKGMDPGARIEMGCLEAGGDRPTGAPCLLGHTWERGS